MGASASRRDPDGRRPLRVAMIGQYAIPAAYGGVERVVEELGARLVDRGVDVTVYCAADGRLLPGWRGMTLRGVRTPGGKHVGKLVLSGLAALDSLRRDYDVVHFHAMGPCLFAPLVRWTGSAKVVATIHGRDDLRDKWSLPARWLLRIAAFLSARVPHRVMVVSRALQQDYRTAFGADTTVVHNGLAPVPVEGSVEELRRWDLEPGGYILQVGRLVPEKAVDTLIEAFGRTELGDTKLVIVGESAHTDDFAHKVRDAAAADPRVVLTDAVHGAPLDALFRHAAAFALPSRLEGLPVVLLEAVAYGLPVVVSAIPPNLEVVGTSGPGHRVVAVDDVAALGTELERVVKDQDLERAGAELLRAEVSASFSWERAAELTLDVYREVLGERAR